MRNEIVDSKNVGMMPGIMNDKEANYWSMTNIDNAQALAMLDTCLHLQKDYYCDGYLCVPIPPTNNGKTVLFTNIIKITNKHNVGLRFDEHLYLRPMFLSDSPGVSTAKFGQFILANREARDRDKLAGHHEWEIVAIHGLPEKDVPPLPLVMARQVTGPNAKFYHYTPEDFSKSIFFWSRHIIIH